MAPITVGASPLPSKFDRFLDGILGYNPSFVVLPAQFLRRFMAIRAKGVVFIMSYGRFFIISAPSGAGKTTLAKRIVDEIDDTVLAVSHTTRRMRPGETDGVDYFFVDRSEFEAKVVAGDFLEYAEVFGNLYGTSKSEVERLLKAGKSVLLDIDWQGARKVRRQIPEVQSIFVLPPSTQELERRLRQRGQDSDEVISRRMQEAADEMAHRDEYDHEVVNDDLENAMAKLRTIVSGSVDGLRKVTIEI